MLKKILDITNIAVNNSPNIYVKGIEHRTENGDILIRVYYYILDDYAKPEWIDNDFLRNNLKINFNFTINSKKTKQW